MRNMEPPFGRGSAMNSLEIFFSSGAIAAMKSDICAWTMPRNRSLLASNQPRSLLALRSLKNAKNEDEKPRNSAMDISLISMHRRQAGEEPLRPARVLFLKECSHDHKTI